MNFMAYLKLLRPIQWLKNLMLFFPPFLGGSLFQQGLFLAGLLPLVAFCLASSATYICNDILDRERDREHPVKKKRALASGAVSLPHALGLAVFLFIISISLALQVSLPFVYYIFGYLLVSFCYSLWLKGFPVVDLFCISLGFLLRLMAGGEAFGIVVSEWLFLSVFLLSIFLSTGKRCSEKIDLGILAGKHRHTLISYPEGYLQGVLFMTGSAVLVTYTMYVVSHHRLILLYTVPLCCFGLLRYILRVQSGKGGDPTESLTRDVPLLLVGAVWVVMVGWGIYG